MDLSTLTKYRNLAHCIVAIVGLACIIIAVNLNPQWYTVFMSIGTALLATVAMSVITCYFMSVESQLRSTVLTWGLKGIFEQRSQINPISEAFLKTSTTLDIIACGLKSFLDARQSILEQRLKEGNFRLRILTIDPESDTCNDMDKFEGETSSHTRETIQRLLGWAKSLNSPNLEIRVYDGVPLEFYFCYDTDMFVGPHHPKSSQQTITLQFSTSGEGASVYKQYFEEAWNKAKTVQ